MDQSFSERLNIGVDDDLLPLSEDTLARNLGLDLIVVVTKVYTNNLLTKSLGYDVRFYLLQIPQ